MGCRDRPLKRADRPGQRLPGHPTGLPGEDGGDGVDLRRAGLLVHEDHHIAIALVDRAGILPPTTKRTPFSDTLPYSPSITSNPNMSSQGPLSVIPLNWQLQPWLQLQHSM